MCAVACLLSVVRARGSNCASPRSGGGLLRAVPLDKPFLLSTLRVVATLVIIIM